MGLSLRDVLREETRKRKREDIFLYTHQAAHLLKTSRTFSARYIPKAADLLKANGPRGS